MSERAWIPARDVADRWVAAGNYGGLSQAIGNRARDGLIQTRAAKLIGIDDEDGLIPDYFWWSRGGSPMEFDWFSGDITTTLEGPHGGSRPARAYGVEFDRASVEAFLPITQTAAEVPLAAAPDPKRPGPKRSDKWDDWIAEVVIAGYDGVLKGDMTDTDLINLINDRLAKREVDEMARSTVQGAVARILTRLQESGIY